MGRRLHCAVPSRCHFQLFVTPWTVAHQAPLSIGFSRQEYQSGCHALLQGNLPNPGIKPRSPTLQVDSLPTEPPGKPKNTGMGSLSLLQRIFATQEWRWCLLHCRRIFFQASYRGSPPNSISGTKPRLLAASWQHNGFSTLCITTPHSNTQQRKGCFSLIFLC